ncbi:SAP30-binding protein-like isoform X2 [Ptychodera flava]|uniref:SAP30-binding protein-like isoform X2 n=1 Tax=Ptychodera flava TaxID=63121 RepID=UPI00396A6AE4
MAEGMTKSESSTAMLALANYAGDSEPEISGSDDEEYHKEKKPAKREGGLVSLSYGGEEDEKKVKEIDSGDEKEVLEENEAEVSVESIRQNLVDNSYLDMSVNSDSLSQSVRHLPTEQIQLPQEPPGRCSNHLQNKISNYFKKGFDLNGMIQKRKDFRNPSIYEKLISFLQIDEMGTNYPSDMFDPHSWPEESYYEALAKAQKEDMAKREKERKDRTKVEFVSGTVKKVGAGGATAATATSSTDTGKKRKSKWDQSGTTVAVTLPRPAITVVTTSVPNPQVVSVTTTATGTKTTVISALGTIKKPKLEK